MHNKIQAMFLKEIEVRWSDLDANRHLANISYFKYMIEARMAFLAEKGLTHYEMAKNNFGPIIFYEHMYYFKEAFPGKPIKVSAVLTGISEDGKFFEFQHDFYDDEGNNFARCQIMGSWMDLEHRKLIALADVVGEAFSALKQEEGLGILTKEDTRKYVQVPKPLI